MKKLIIYGASYPDILNLIKSINEKEKQWDVIGFLDDSANIRDIKGIPVLGDKSYIKNNNLQETYLFNNVYNISIFYIFNCFILIMVSTSNLLVMFLSFEFIFFPTIYYIYKMGYTRKVDKANEIIFY